MQRFEDVFSKYIEKRVTHPALLAGEVTGIQIATEENAVQNWIVRIQSDLLYSAADEFVANYDEIMCGEYKGELLGTAPVRVLAEMLSDIAYRYAFTSKEIFKIELSVKVR